ncbi:Cyclin-like F-box [Ophiocordyceps camponoti-floridani]|uniref:Cyclin-like F-box n=1 Tax=Ophiocordyceps camponoti-floridani TaxID=2030778 RepID=A0A8H4VD59_9HYPO|nr:Cyclin-like F-box [Ophiocordyceps camponoti-floridani]
MAANAGGSQQAAQGALFKPSLCFLGLPPETQHEIVSHCSQADLVCLALVSKRCRELASAQLYRNFHIVFPDEDDVSFDSPIDGLAGGLDTFTTSNYNYAQHLRDLSMDTLSAGGKAEQSYQPYLYNVSCGKFLNSLLCQTLRKTHSLETFRWNIRVELSRPVYRQLHCIASLTRLHVRMQSGASYYCPLPPLPSGSADMHGANPYPPQPQPPPSTSKSTKAERRGPGHVRAPTFSGFKGLKSLGVLDIESIDVVREIRACIRNSFSTLKGLQLSLSDSYAQQARSPSVDSDADDSEVDDDFQVIPSSQNSSYDAGAAVQEERKIQEAILGKIFDVEPRLVRRSPINRRHNGDSTERVEATEPCEGNPRDNFISSIKAVSEKLVALQQGTRDFTMSQQDMLETIEQAARLYVDSCKREASNPSTETAAADATSKLSAERAAASGESSQMGAEEQGLSVDNGANDYAMITGSSISDKHREADPDDVDIAYDMETQEEEASMNKPTSRARASGSVIKAGDIKYRHESRRERRGPSQDAKSREMVKESMEAYVRDTRGLSLESLSVYLVPVKASVLSRGVDVTCLKQLTLLNVGNQTPIWSMLAKEGRTQPLALRSVFTDHVTPTFLTCMAQLPELHDLLLLGRSVKHKPESFAPRVSTTMDQIRRLVLRKHMATLKRLMIKDESLESNWDANEKTMILICCRGVKLEELALSMNIKALHAFMQYLSGLVSLRAVSILRFKNGDTCMWVMREILRFIVDNLSHHPELKLEWIAMDDDHVDRVVRPSETGGDEAEKKPVKKRSKGEGKAVAVDGTYPPLPTDGLYSDSSSDEDERCDGGTKLRFKTVGPLQFYDVWGVRIFDKEVRSGRL